MLWYFHFLFPQSYHRFMCQHFSSPTLPNNRALRIWYTIWQKIAAALAQNGSKRILGWASLYCWFRSLKFPFRPVHGLACDILCLSALISSFVCVYTSLTCSLLDTTHLTVYSRYATSSFRFWCFRLDRDFSLQKNALVFWMIRTWKNGLIFGRTYQNLLLFEKWIRFWKMRSVSVEMDLFLEEMD